MRGILALSLSMAVLTNSSMVSAKDLTGTFLICDQWPVWAGFRPRPKGPPMGVYFFSRENYSEIDVNEEGGFYGLMGDRVPPEAAWHRLPYYEVRDDNISLHVSRSERGRYKDAVLINIDRRTLKYSAGEAFKNWSNPVAGSCEISSFKALEKRSRKFFDSQRAAKEKEAEDKGYKL